MTPPFNSLEHRLVYTQVAFSVALTVEHDFLSPKFLTPAHNPIFAVALAFTFYGAWNRSSLSPVLSLGQPFTYHHDVFRLSRRRVRAGRGGGVLRGAACLSKLIIDHALLQTRRSTVPAPNRDTSNILGAQYVGWGGGY